MQKNYRKSLNLSYWKGNLERKKGQAGNLLYLIKWKCYPDKLSSFMQSDLEKWMNSFLQSYQAIVHFVFFMWIKHCRKYNHLILWNRISLRGRLLYPKFSFQILFIIFNRVTIQWLSSTFLWVLMNWVIYTKTQKVRCKKRS